MRQDIKGICPLAGPDVEEKNDIIKNVAQKQFADLEAFLQLIITINQDCREYLSYPNDILRVDADGNLNLSGIPDIDLPEVILEKELTRRIRKLPLNINDPRFSCRIHDIIAGILFKRILINQNPNIPSLISN